MATALYSGIASALSDALSVAGQKFTWNGQFYDCIVNAEAGSLVTSKALFSQGGYPRVKDTIRVDGKSYQVTKVANAASEYVPGGMIDTSNPFVDDPTNPALAIAFDTFINP